jgi:hypothetical protein
VIQKAKGALTKFVASSHSRQRIAKSQLDNMAEGLLVELEETVRKCHEQVPVMCDVSM